MDVQLPREPYRGGMKVTLDELFSSGFIEKLQVDVPANYWPQMISRALDEKDLLRGFQVLQKIMRKEIRKNGRIPFDMLCPIMRSINPADADAQFDHCKSCLTCRFIASAFDFHAFKFELETLAADFFIQMLSEGLSNAEKGIYKVNNCPFVDRNNQIDESNGFCWIAPGCGSHSTYPRGNKHIFAPRAGIRLAETFVVMNFIAQGNFVSGEYHVSRRNELNILIKSYT